MTLKKQSTVIFVHSTAHWEAIQQQKAQILGVSSPSVKEQEEKRRIEHAQRQSAQQQELERQKKPSRLIGKEGSRRRQRWTNNTFLEHPNAVLYAEDLQPPGYKEHDKGLYQTITEILSKNDNEMLLWDSHAMQKETIPQVLSRHIRHDLKKSHISQGFVTNYESQLLTYINSWLDDPTCLDNAYLTVQVVSNNKFERYILHVMCRYYGFYSFSESNSDDIRITYICHPAYMKYVTTKDVNSIDYADIENWIMPERSFFDYLFH